MQKKLQVAVLVENHPYDVVSFQKMLDSLESCDCFVQPIDLFVQDEKNRDRYDVVLWYNMNWSEPAADSVLRRYMEQDIGKNGQGIVLLHHALLTFQGWPLYTQVCGLSDRGGDHFQFHQNEVVHQHILPLNHPITAGVEDFIITDETYSIGEPDQPGNTVLITTDNQSGVRNIAWVRQYRNSRVFCYASGHDNAAYADPNVRKILLQGLRWAAGTSV